MPATAGRVRMPANNRVHSSAALQTHGIWQSAIGYDPYAPAKKDDGSKPDKNSRSGNDADNAYASFQGLLALARITGTNSNETRGACKKCGRVGHLTYQCRNFLSLKDDVKQNDDSALPVAEALFEKIKKENGVKEGEESDEDDGDSELSSSSDAEVDPEIEKIIAERFGKNMSKKLEALSKRSKRMSSRSTSSDDDDEDEDAEGRRKKRKHGHKKRRRSHHRRRSDSDDDSESDRHHKRKRRRRRESDSDSSSESSDNHHRKRSDRHRKRRHKERRSVLSSGTESTGSSSDEDERRERRRSRGHK